MRGVKGFHDFFRTVGEVAVAKKEAEATEREISLMGFDNPVSDEDSSYAIIAPLPAIAFRKSAKLNGAVDFCVFVGFVAAIAPSKAAENANLRCDLLFKIEAETVTVAALAASGNDIRNGRLAILEIANRLLVISHVGLIEITEEANDAVAMENAIAARFEFEIFGARTSDVCVEIDSVGDLGHQRFGEANGPPVIVVLKDHAVGVAARVRGVVVGAVVVDGPIEKLQVAIGAVGIHVEEIDHIGLSDAERDPARWKRSGEVQRVALCFNALPGEWDNLSQHEPCKVGCL